ncbi:nucleoside hydrolase [Cohnella nanjingensis]|uniref:Nucleoside hydrolase n=1 Tax=Cohnella nanjingensis TaxID=1387779 RepID=A0A7X0RTE6_9BACL|nr:nucleoside hydrolase [Cohnella nanjingensis]MBB6673367.1 nucleoside hydrolase [Cohnella nanjingensis]
MNVYFNHDGGGDDFVALLLLLRMPDVRLTGVSVIPADGYLEPSVQASCKIIDRFGAGDEIEVARSDSRGKNPFPAAWRIMSFYVDALPILNEAERIDNPIVPLPAHRHLIQKVLETEGKTTLVFTGPLTDLARALDESPEIEARIERLVWMGGTFLPKGNVEEPEHDGTAEWNAYWDPEATARVWASGIPIDLVALESTNRVPLTLDVRDAWAKLRRHEAIDFIGQCYALVPPLVFFETNSTYYLWDVLTAAYVGKPDLVKTKTVRSIVRTDGFAQGRTQEDPEGRPVNLVYDVDRDGFFGYMTELLKQA